VSVGGVPVGVTPYASGCPGVGGHSNSTCAAQFAFRPQVIQISGLEYLIGISRSLGVTPHELFSEKLALPFLQTGEWEVYLGSRMTDDMVPTCWEGVLSRLFASVQERLDRAQSSVGGESELPDRVADP